MATETSARYASKATALKVARTYRAQGKAVRVFHHAGVYTQPGKGLTQYSYFTVPLVDEFTAPSLSPPMP